MSSQRIQVFVPLPVVVPQGAQWAGHAAVWLGRGLSRIGHSVWAALEAHGHRRAARELHAAADRYQRHNPALANALRAASRYSPSKQDSK